MENFMPTNLQGWVVVIGGVLTILGVILNKTVKEPLDRVSSNLEKLETHINNRLDDHDNRLNSHDLEIAKHGQAIKYLESEKKK